MLAIRGSPAPTQVQQITSACCKSSFSACRFSARYLFSSLEDNSPVSSLSSCSLASSPLLVKQMSRRQNIRKRVFSFIFTATFLSMSTANEKHNSSSKVLIRAKTLMQKLNNGSILFIFNKKWLYPDDGHFII